MGSRPALNTARFGPNALRHPKDRYRELIESIPNPVIILDNDNRVDAMSRQAIVLARPSTGSSRKSSASEGKNSEHLLGKPVDMVFPWISEDIDSLGRTGNGEHGFEKVIEIEGTLKNYRVRTSELTDGFGRRRGWVIALEDITEWKRTETALRESRERFQHLMNHSSSGVAVYEPVDGGKDFIIKDMNPSAERICRIKKADYSGKSVQKVFPGVRSMGLLDVFQRVWKSGKPERHPVSLYRDEKLTSWFENEVYRLPSGELVAVYDDVTEKKQSESALMETTENLKRNIDELQRANQKILKQQKAVIEEERLKVLLQMAGATAHELNQPLMALLGNIELMTWEKGDSERLVDRARKIEKAGKRIADIVKKIQTIRHYELKPYPGNSQILKFDQKVHILAVDDSDPDIDRLEAILADRSQIRLSRAHDIHEVFSFLSKTPVNLVFLDYMLPSGTGLDVLNRLREEGHDVPVIFITGQGDEMIASKAINSGAYDYLPKVNVTRESLNRVIKNTLDKFRLKKEVEMTMEKLAEMTIRDELTRLYNRRYFMEVLERETSTVQRYDTQLVLCMMDLDHFKNINDTYGHPAGDALLRSVAELLRKTVRKSDVPCRYGGEEFAVILPNTSIEHAKVFCERFRKKVENLTVPHGEEKLKVTISIGLAQYAKGKSSGTLLERSDHALYLAKSGGRNRVESVP